MTAPAPASLVETVATLVRGSDVLGYDTARLAGLYEIGATGAVS